ncbi:MAG: hypothetical protein RMA76_02570 [Deltaproteobacteria bacterium]
MAKDASTRNAILVTVLVTLVFLAGIWAGRFLTRLQLEAPIAQWDRARTLGALVKSDEDRRARAQAYDDPDQAIAAMDGYGWAPPNLPAPFVGVGPAPGEHTGITIGAGLFRGRDGVEMPKPPGRFRVFVTGGSTAFSSGAPSEEATIGAFLGACLKKTRANAEVITLANPAWASTQERIAIEQRISELAPDVVVSFTGVNDVHWGVRGRDTAWFRTYWDETFYRIDAAVFDLAGRPFADPIVVTEAPTPVERLAEVFTKNVAISGFVLDRVGARYVVALQPNLAVSSKQITAREEALLEVMGEERRAHYVKGYEAFRAGLGAVDAANVSWWDLSDVFAGRSEEIFLDNYHFGDRGNRIIAEALCARFEELSP